MTVPAILFVDRWGRRPTLLFGAFFMLIFMFANVQDMNHGEEMPRAHGVGRFQRADTTSDGIYL